MDAKMIRVRDRNVLIDFHNGYYEVALKRKDGYLPLFDGYAETLSEKMLDAIRKEVEWYLINQEKHCEKRKRTKTADQNLKKGTEKVAGSAEKNEKSSVQTDCSQYDQPVQCTAI